jgi:hypothetical protein
MHCVCEGGADFLGVCHVVCVACNFDNQIYICSLRVCVGAGSWKIPAKLLQRILAEVSRITKRLGCYCMLNRS